MGVLVRKRSIPFNGQVHQEPDLSLKVRVGTLQAKTDVFPDRTDDEPLFYRFRCRAGVRTPEEYYEGPAQVVITSRRVLMMIFPGMKPKGLDPKRHEIALVSVERSEIAAPEIDKSLTGKVKSVHFRGKVEDFIIGIPYIQNFSDFLDKMAPENAQGLSTDAYAKRQGAERHKAEKDREAASQEAAEVAQQNAKRFTQDRGSAGPNRTSPLGLAKGMFDHRRTWRYRTSLSADQCIAGFVAAFTGRGGLLLKAKWSVERAGAGAVAIYDGRKGLVALSTGLSERAQSEEAGAVGSQIRFEVEEEGATYAVCAMWLAQKGSVVGLTLDARFFRPYMRAVERELRRADPSLKVVKDVLG
jgi:hypothetical protein